MLQITQNKFPEIGPKPTAQLSEKICTMLPYELSGKGNTKHNQFAIYCDEVYVSKDTLSQILKVKESLPESFEEKLFLLVRARYPEDKSVFHQLRRCLIEEICINSLEKVEVDPPIKNLFIGMTRYSLGYRLGDVSGD
ncbi:MAG: hypothetical protein QG669_469 [Patescibacteria group bacterium]|jgi:hypothetical protein|nr:hypothetical protein [Patescibacteria group bacterium]MDQ5962076.1 hypothetical protein [Patescibacteria group bacterium]